MSNLTGKVYPDSGGKWRWRIMAQNGRKVACSGESFHSKWNARRALGRFTREIVLGDYRLEKP